MTKYLQPLAFVLALAFLALTFVNASWIAATPRGYLKLVALRGVHQLPAASGTAPGACPAAAIEAPIHDYLENTVPAMQAASAQGAQVITVDVVRTSDGHIAAFGDDILDCRTSGTGKTRSKTLAELKALDAGYGYSADGGKTFPFRGKGLGLIPSLEEVLQALPEKPILFALRGTDRAEAAALAAALKAAGRPVEAIGDGFSGSDSMLAPIRSQFPKAWAFGREGAQACTSAYRWQGWLGLTPAACRGGTIVIPLDRQWTFAGWPNRLIARMAAVGAKVVVTGPGGKDSGLFLPEQIREVPAGFNGYLLAEDVYAIGPAIRPQYGKRNPVQEKRFDEAMEWRRQARAE